MSYLTEVVLRSALIGVGATVIMDLWLMALKMLNLPTMNFALLGRWVGYMPGGGWLHHGIAKSAPVRNELMIGWLTHYAVGICFAGLLVATSGAVWMRYPSLIPAIATGIATAIAPLFIMQPAMGSGIASSKTA